MICQCETKTVRAIPWKPFIYNIKQCLNLESNDLKLTVIQAIYFSLSLSDFYYNAVELENYTILAIMTHELIADNTE